MSSNEIKNPFGYFRDTEGNALDAGKIYIGVSGLDAELNPKDVFTDAAMTLPIVQPVRTSLGAPYVSGSPINIYTDGAYSIKVTQSNDVLVYSANVEVGGIADQPSYVFQSRDFDTMTLVASLSDGTVSMVAGLQYTTNSSTSLPDSAAADLGVAGIDPFGAWVLSDFSELPPYLPVDQVIEVGGVTYIAAPTGATDQDETTPDGVKLYLQRAVDIAIGIGQSNTEGRGDSTLSPASPTGLYINGTTITAPLADPVGNAATGSLWPSFANAWYELTGNSVAVADAATGGTNLLPNASGDWSPNGVFRAAAVNVMNNAITAIENSPRYVLGRAFYVWGQGENEAQNINNTTISGPLYTDALIVLAEYLKANVPIMERMYVFGLGVENGQYPDLDWGQIRRAQEFAAQKSNLIELVDSSPSGFGFAGRRLMGDTLHYNQEGLNYLGNAVASGINEGRYPLDPPTVLASTAYPDTSTTAAATATNVHTNKGSTQAMLVVATAHRITNNTTYDIDSVTFDGVALTRLNEPAATPRAGNSTPAGNAYVSMYLINDSEVPETLAGRSGDIVVTTTQTSNIIDTVVIELGEQVLEESGYTFLRFAGGGNAIGSTFDLDVSFGAPSLVVAALSSVSDGAAPLTHTFPDTLTEIMDSGASNGTRSGQAFVGIATMGPRVAEPFNIQTSADASAGAYYIKTFRRA